eukprot:CAMPEP_0117004904 /NCGR_PEP_ID=MMETSP0472-20121206/5719_1 /TAXON_ID=693140 ORGANISM="Tiarina fusus, Strain LIS" /NCGR_SAMPLE_ID=MMETSP0472 /ASSEMBLY_ACC=CAM_ASM_000603 /LENGTH=244 /DNA_ID=CAMNT_0004706009 /DNA_START=37 /DNA_END=771 /DNA_ORIENTATION=-
MGNKASSDASLPSTASVSDRSSSTGSQPEKNTRKSSSRNNTTSRRSNTTSRRSKKFVPGPSPVPKDASPAMQTVLKWIDAKNRHDIMQVYCFCHEDAKFHFLETDVHMPMQAFFHAMVDAFTSLPDMSFSYQDIQEPVPGVIRLIDYVGAGHHKGNMAFGDKPVLAPTGKLLADAPCEMTITVNGDNKITCCVVDAKGQLAGPLGFYAKAQREIEKIAAKNKSLEKDVAAEAKKNPKKAAESLR